MSEYMVDDMMNALARIRELEAEAAMNKASREALCKRIAELEAANDALHRRIISDAKALGDAAEEQQRRAEKAEAEYAALIAETRKLRDEAYAQGRHDAEAETFKRCAEAMGKYLDDTTPRGRKRAIRALARPPAAAVPPEQPT